MPEVLAPTDELADVSRRGDSPGVVVHGANAGVARPAGFAVVHWIGTVVPTNSIDGDFFTNTNDLADYVGKVGGDTITASAAGVKPLILKGAAGQTANLQEWQDSTGAVLASMRSDGNLFAGGGLASIGHPSRGTALYVESGAAGQVGTIVKGAASQTANLFEVQNSAGIVVAGVGANGIWIGTSAMLASSATAGTNGSLPAQVSTYLFVQISGTNYKIPLFN